MKNTYLGHQRNFGKLSLLQSQKKAKQKLFSIIEEHLNHVKSKKLKEKKMSIGLLIHQKKFIAAELEKGNTNYDEIYAKAKQRQFKKEHQFRMKETKKNNKSF